MGQSLIVYLVVGVFFGWLVGRFVEGYGFGLWGNMVVGVVGAMIADQIASSIWVIAIYDLGAHIIISVFGAAIPLLIIGLFKRRGPAS
jgi:uncharacterized membrane protein YeaQ/YmgE (transglycosylase-associated protein family)